MIRRRLTIVNRLGLHARAAARLVSLASGYRARLLLRRGDKEVNAKSIMWVMMLAAARGSEVELLAEGEDEEAAAEAIARLVAERFGEPE